MASLNVETKPASRTVIIRRKSEDAHKSTYVDKGLIKGFAKKKIHNLESIEFVELSEDHFKNWPFLVEGSDRILGFKVTLKTTNPSYDLNGFYQELTKNGYIIC